MIFLFVFLDEFPKDGCHICGMPKSEMAAYEHVEGACNQRPISCPLCSKTFSLWSHFESHKKCHQKLKQRQYPCQACGKVWNIFCIYIRSKSAVFASCKKVLYLHWIKKLHIFNGSKRPMCSLIRKVFFF